MELFSAIEFRVNHVLKNVIFEQQVHLERSRLFSGDHQGNFDSLLQGALISRSPLKRTALALTFISLAAAAK
jgi:hypothetical protein